MADGDVLHSGLAWRYQLPYRQLCEGVLSEEGLAHTIGERIKRDVKEHYGNLTAQSRAVAARLEHLSDAARARQEIDWVSERRDVSAECSGSGSKRNSALLNLAAQGVANDIEDGCFEGDAARSLARRFLDGLYKSRFGDAVVTTEEHFDAVAPADIERRLERLQPYIDRQLDHIGEQMARAKEGARPRLGLLRRKNEKIDLDSLDSSVGDLWN